MNIDRKPLWSEQFDVITWGLTTVGGFGLLGLLMTLYFPNGRPVVPVWSIALLMLIIMMGMWIWYALASSSADQDGGFIAPEVARSLDYRLKIRVWVPNLFMPVTFVLIMSALLQRLSAQPRRKIWQWLGLSLGALPFLVTTLLLMVVISST